MLCDSTEIALRIDSHWSRSQIRQSVRAALCFPNIAASTRATPNG